MSLGENDLWLLSFYRHSEMTGALFFGRLARAGRSSAIQANMTRHFADEAQHARYWTDCIDGFGVRPVPVDSAYQDRYLEAAGLPANLMEVLAITQVFERRVIGQYARHARVAGIQPEVRETLERIMRDEVWHVRWVAEALAGMESEYGKEAVQAAQRRCREADQQVYGAILAEYGERLQHLLGVGKEAEEV